MKVLFLGQANNLQPWFGDVLRAVGEEHQVVLWQAGSPLGPQIEDAQVVIEQGGGVASRETIDAAGRAGVRLWQVLGTGLDHVDVQYILDRGLPLANTPGPFSSVALAEHALFLMLYFAKNFLNSQRNLRSGIFYRPMNDELEGATLGLIGLGASARELSRRAAAFGMRLVSLDIQPPTADVLSSLGITYLGGPETLDELLGESDYASVHVPLTRRTRHMVDARALARMQPHGVLINVARGGIVDQDALVQALRSGSLRGAGLDVFAAEPLDLNSPLFGLDNVVLTPHVAGVTTGTSRRRAEAVAENVRRTAAGLPPLYAVTRAE
jgi:D-3-phosphoglycerate dehydrogenase / 2-oxoglutarate reductase